MAAVRAGGNKALMRKMVRIFETGDLSHVAAVVDAEYIDHQGLGQTALKGAEGFRRVVTAARTAFPDLRASIEDLIAEDDRVVARLEWHGTRPTGEHVDRETIDIVRFAGGRAVEHWGTCVSTSETLRDSQPRGTDTAACDGKSRSNILSKDLLLYHLDRTYAHDSMSPALSSAVRGLTPAQAAWKPSADRHSIWQIVRHLAHWKEATLSALDGNPVDYNGWNKADWQEVSASQRDWDSDVEQLRLVSAELYARLQQMDDEALSRSIVWYRRRWSQPYPVAHRLLNQATHDVYHTGQIQYLLALQGIPVEERGAQPPGTTRAASRTSSPAMQTWSTIIPETAGPPCTSPPTSASWTRCSSSLSMEHLQTPSRGIPRRTCPSTRRSLASEIGAPSPVSFSGVGLTPRSAMRKGARPWTPLAGRETPTWLPSSNSRMRMPVDSCMPVSTAMPERQR